VRAPKQIVVHCKRSVIIQDEVSKAGLKFPLGRVSLSRVEYEFTRKFSSSMMMNCWVVFFFEQYVWFFFFKFDQWMSMTVVKPLLVNDSAKAHALSLAFNAASLSELKPPVVLQEFVNHGEFEVGRCLIFNSSLFLLVEGNKTFRM
jgi:hypothetical protein